MVIDVEMERPLEINSHSTLLSPSPPLQPSVSPPHSQKDQNSINGATEDYHF